MKFNYLKHIYTNEHEISVLKELQGFIEQSRDNVDEFFEQLAKLAAFTDIMNNFWFENGNQISSEKMHKYSNEIRDIHYKLSDEIKSSKEEFNIVDLKKFIERELNEQELNKQKINE